VKTEKQQERKNVVAIRTLLFYLYFSFSKPRLDQHPRSIGAKLFSRQLISSKHFARPYPKLSFRNLSLFPDILETHEPTRHKTAYSRSSSQVKNAIDTIRIGSQHTSQPRSLDDRPESRRSSIDDNLGIDGRRVFWNKGFETIGEDGIGETEEQGSCERLAERDERHRDRDLGWGQSVLDGDKRLRKEVRGLMGS
jgi:hypothetical protein